MEETYAYKRIFKAEKFNKTKLSNAISDLRGRLKEFLLWQYLQKPSLDKDFLLKILQQQSFDGLAQKQLKNIATNLHNIRQPDLWFWEQLLRLAHEKYFNNHSEKIAFQTPQIEGIMTKLDDFYALAKLRYSCELYQRQQILNEPVSDIRFLEKILEQDFSKTSIAHQCYQAALPVIQQKAEAGYYLLKQLVLGHLEQLHLRDQHILVTYLTNFAAHKIRKGNRHFIREIFDIYQQGLQFEFFSVNGVFNDMHFGNILDVACSLQEYEWAEQFIKDWGGKLTDLHRAEIITFSNAFILYEKQEFSTALDLLRTTFKKNIFYIAKAKRLELVCLFELDYEDVFLLSMSRAFEQLLRCNGLISEALRKSLLNFNKFFRLLLSPHQNKTQLLEKLNQTEFIMYKQWLIAKILELK
ncbi:MAG: hypothetical protein ACI9XO_003288 [Paraglaciecola sp.]